MSKLQSAQQSQLWIEAQQLRREAEILPAGRARDGLLERASRLELSATVHGWISSPGLRCPEGKRE